MKALAIIISIILFIICLGLAVIVLMQQGKSAGLSGAISGAAESYFGKNKARTMEGKMERLTKILAISYLVLCFILYYVAAAI